MAQLPSVLRHCGKVLVIGSLIVTWAFWGPYSVHYGAIKSSVPSSIVTQWGSAISTLPQMSSRPLVLYAYSESANARINLDFFIKKGLHGRADFLFMFNGETNATGMVPDRPNIEIVQRENTCFDIGGIGEVLRKNDRWKKYKRFITMNASIRGPFLPVYHSGCWMDAFLKRITDEVKLVGTTLNCVPRPHIQSMLLATDDIGMAILLDPKLAKSTAIDDHYGSKDDPVGFTPCFSSLMKAIHSEIGISNLIWSQGYEVEVMLSSVQAESSPKAYCEANGWPDDVLWEGKYFGTNVHPYETIFLKTNRDIDPVLVEDLTKWHLSQERSSWDMCGR